MNSVTTSVLTVFCWGGIGMFLISHIPISPENLVMGFVTGMFMWKVVTGV